MDTTTIIAVTAVGSLGLGFLGLILKQFKGPKEETSDLAAMHRGLEEKHVALAIQVNAGFAELNANMRRLTDELAATRSELHRWARQFRGLGDAGD